MAEPERIRFYTSARSIPYFLGKVGDFVLPGGPYSLTQGVVGAVVLFVCLWTKKYWSTGNEIIDFIISGVLAAGACYLSGRINFKNVNPISICAGLWEFFGSPVAGSRADEKVRIKPYKTKMHRWEPAIYKNELVFDESKSVKVDAGQIEALPIRDEFVEEKTIPASAHQLTKIQQMLAASAQRKDMANG